MCNSIEIALRTWYPKDHPLHLNPHHPLGKLLGEWGELLDDYMKSLYKPGYVFEPEDELGDIWYYLRILCYQKGYEPELVLVGKNIDHAIAVAMSNLSASFVCLKNYDEKSLDSSYSALRKICSLYNLTLDDLTRSNWQKLKPGSERGEEWTKAR